MRECESKEVKSIAKTDLTKELEKRLWRATNKLGTFGCFEVTIGIGGIERVDYLTYDTKGIWRCYEIKVSKEDFYSKAAKTFVGHYNYYVMPATLYEIVKHDIPKHIGVHDGSGCIKPAMKQELTVDEQVLKDSMIRSLFREYEKFIKTCDPDYINKANRKIARLEAEARSCRNEVNDYRQAIFLICEKYSLNYAEVRKYIREVI